MPDSPRQVVFLVDRIVNLDQSATLRALVEHLADWDLAAMVVCTSAIDDLRRAVPVIERPGLLGRWRLPWTLRGFRPDGLLDGPSVLHVLQSRMAPAGLEIAERLRIPCLQSVEEFLPEGSKLRLSRAWSRGLIATTRDIGNDLIEGFGVPPDAVRVIPRGLILPDPPTIPRAPDAYPVIGTAGPLDPGSGFSTFLNAARKILDSGLDAEFVLVGQGEEEGDLRRRADRLKLTDRLTFVAESAIGVSFWDVLDIYCQPSTEPTVGRNLARALAHGLPCVASDIEGLRALVTDDLTGVRVPPGESNALASALIHLLRDPDRRQRLGQTGRATVAQDYDLDRESSMLAEIYHAILDAEPARTTTDPARP